MLKGGNVVYIVQKFVTNNNNFNTPRTITVRGIMMHSVGTPQPNPDILASIFNTPTPSGRSVGVHAFVGADGRVVQTLPWQHRSWHSGGTANDTHIGLEMTEPITIRYTSGSSWQDNNPIRTREFVLGTYNTSVKLCAELCKQFNLDPLKDGVIISHSEGHRRGVASNHGDVEHIWNRLGLTMNQFRRDVSNAMQPERVTVLLNGVELPERGLLVDGRTFLPVRALENTRYIVESWDGATKTVRLKTI
jgi:hypothetical protein